MGSRTWDLQINEANLNVRENVLTKDLKLTAYGEGLREKPSIHVSKLGNKNMTFSESVAFLKILTHFHKCVFSFSLESTLKDDSISRQTDASNLIYSS